MPNNYGKQFERKFKMDWMKTFPNGTIDRIYDTTMGYAHISNVSDFIAYDFPFEYYLECKSTEQGTFNIKKLTQKDKLSEKQGIKGVNAGVIIWFISKRKVCYVPIEEVLRLEKEGFKSISCKMIGDPLYKVYEVESKAKMVFLDSNYSIVRVAAEKKLEEFNK